MAEHKFIDLTALLEHEKEKWEYCQFDGIVVRTCNYDNEGYPINDGNRTIDFSKFIYDAEIISNDFKDGRKLIEISPSDNYDELYIPKRPIEHLIEGGSE